MDLPKVYQQALLALEQMMDTHGRLMQNLKREIFLLVQLTRIIMNFKADEIPNIICNYSQENQELLNTIFAHVGGIPTEIDELLDMESFFVVEGVSFPEI